jgi:CreA protein
MAFLSMVKDAKIPEGIIVTSDHNLPAPRSHFRNIFRSGAYITMNTQKSPSRILCALAALVVFPLSAVAETVGNVDVDWLGNDIVVEAVADPKVKGNWFEDPSNSSISCRQTGPIEIGDIERDDEGETVFTERRSVIFKTLNVKRIYDEANNTLIYISHARDVQNGSAKMSMSTVPLYASGN